MKRVVLALLLVGPMNDAYGQYGQQPYYPQLYAEPQYYPQQPQQYQVTEEALDRSVLLVAACGFVVFLIWRKRSNAYRNLPA